MNYYIKKIF